MREPRLTAFMADPGIAYQYSNRDNEGIGWHPEIVKIKDKATLALNDLGLTSPGTFNSVQLNGYDG
eukprot:6679806-Karenia_brevis.AAC.1